MKITRNETQWQTLIQNQQTSGLTISKQIAEKPNNIDALLPWKIKHS
ncbi:hypothetical protein [Photobacterium profundum]|uniref:Uncharacterized protein n=1 Tax=Photobacterium profundum 3TCK TaxID=314280 RepID=Q1Z6C1_9GAMM|nr:hypothetical protein [Photobacterium profundum]EAS44226.1 hypothetical protein P3TCK_11103 [Photobacterium profundum 3TCK]